MVREQIEREHIEFVTGKLAEPALRAIIEPLSARLAWDYSITVLPISVAALMTPTWIARRWTPDPRARRAILPGYCEGDLTELERRAGIPVHRGPRDLRALPDYFGQRRERENYGDHSIQILAEINHAPRLATAELRAIAAQLRADGADVIDVGCEPGGGWSGAADAVRSLRDEGHRVSIDSLDIDEISAAVRAGAELVLSVNSSNRHAAPDWGVEVVLIPDSVGSIDTLPDSMEWLENRGVPFRVDPVLEPIGCGFAASLARYTQIRRQFPDVGQLMGIGNLTELTEADSAAINLLLLAICEELRIDRVLTTQVIPWARSSVRECAIARKLTHYAVREKVPPKHVDSSLVLLRDPRVESFGLEQLAAFADSIRDHNYRLFAEEGQVHLISAGLHLHSADPFLIFDQLRATAPRNLDPGHAFYLGFEMAKAALALQLGKNYRQDESLDWGFLTVKEPNHHLASHRLRRTHEPIDDAASEPDAAASCEPSDSAKIDPSPRAPQEDSGQPGDGASPGLGGSGAGG
ncbi:MAG: dihydropteroate synthase [Planctomycetes bacterium]|nr:dihydropteroate synthase [Planctomycetota bacterium]